MSVSIPTKANPQAIKAIFDRQLAHAPVQAQTTAKERLERIRRIEKYLRTPANVSRLEEALYRDFRKHPAEVQVSEVSVVFQQITHIKSQLRRWMKPLRVEQSIMLLGSAGYIHYEAKGVCLIIAPWNYPFNLAMIPLVYALAAGNTVMLKPSEISAHTSAYIQEMISELFPADEVAVVEGDAEAAGHLLDLPFNHIFFTGSPQIGKVVMAAAAKHLASVTLELGGKSPAVVDHTVNLNLEAEKCVWAKHLNNGQTCIAPDYLLVEESAKDAFVEGYQKAIDKLYNREGKGVQASPDLCRIISDRHVKRLSGLLEDALAKGATVLAGGQVDEADRFIAPTLLGNVTDDMRIMQEEIFGPIMPLATFTNPEEVVAAIRRRPKPLTMYIGSHRKDFVNYLLSNTSAGGTIINDYLLGFSNPNLPFGGVNNSGIGKSMGLHGFREFSNERGIVRRFLGDLRVIFPPFTKAKMRIVNILTYYLS